MLLSLIRFKYPELPAAEALISQARARRVELWAEKKKVEKGVGTLDNYRAKMTLCVYRTYG